MFYDAYKMKEKADQVARESQGAQHVDDSYSNSGYRSGKSFSMAGRRRKTMLGSA